MGEDLPGKFCKGGIFAGQILYGGNIYRANFVRGEYLPGKFCKGGIFAWQIL